VSVPEYVDGVGAVSKTTKIVDSTTQSIGSGTSKDDYAPYIVAMASIVALLLTGFMVSRRRRSSRG